jgi:hypothetical protein
MGRWLRRLRAAPPSGQTGLASSGSAAAMASAPITEATSDGGRPWPTVGAGPTQSGCWALNPAATPPAAAATGAPRGPPWSTWPAGAAIATTATSGIPTANDSAAPSAATSATRNATAASWQKGAAHGPAPPPHPDPDKDDDLEELGAPVYEGSSLSVRALTTEELQRFLDAHHGQPTQPLGSGWAALDPAGHPAGMPWAAPAAELALPGPRLSASVEPAEGAAGSPGRSALAQYRRRRRQELAAWTGSLVWRALPISVPVRRPSGRW